MQTQLFEHTVNTSANNIRYAEAAQYEIDRVLRRLIETANRPEFDGIVPGSLSITDKVDGYAWVIRVACDLVKKET